MGYRKPAQQRAPTRNLRHHTTNQPPRRPKAAQAPLRLHRRPNRPQNIHEPHPYRSKSHNHNHQPSPNYPRNPRRKQHRKNQPPPSPIPHTKHHQRRIHLAARNHPASTHQHQTPRHAQRRCLHPHTPNAPLPHPTHLESAASTSTARSPNPVPPMD